MRPVGGLYMGFLSCHRKTNTIWRFLAGSTNARAVTILHPIEKDMFQIFYSLLTSLNAHISRGLEGFQSLDLAESA